MPLVRRAVDLDSSTLVRLRRRGDRTSALVRLPFGVLAGRTVAGEGAGPDLDATVRGRDLLAWIDGETDDTPASRDADWRGAAPPATGWRRIDTVPDTDIRPLVRAGALTLKEAAAREGVPGAQPREAVADALLDSIVLTVSDESGSVGVSLRTLSALIRMGFLPLDSPAAVDVTARWIRVAAAYGSVYAERPGLGLTLA
ncbi:MAG: hypothetical protein ACRDVG_12975 [Jatrophihabitantaceae bacterium]